MSKKHRTYYLIDTENPGGYNSLDTVLSKKKGTTAYLFYSDNTARIPLSVAEKILEAEKTKLIEVRTGKNSMDFYLISMVGYLAAKHPKAHLRIMSDDHGYDGAIEMWVSKGIDVQRLGSPVMPKKKKGKYQGKKDGRRNRRNSSPVAEESTGISLPQKAPLPLDTKVPAHEEKTVLSLRENTAPASLKSSSPNADSTGSRSVPEGHSTRPEEKGEKKDPSRKKSASSGADSLSSKKVQKPSVHSVPASEDSLSSSSAPMGPSEEKAKESFLQDPYEIGALPSVLSDSAMDIPEKGYDIPRLVAEGDPDMTVLDGSALIPPADSVALSGKRAVSHRAEPAVMVPTAYNEVCRMLADKNITGFAKEDVYTAMVSDNPQEVLREKYSAKQVSGFFKKVGKPERRKVKKLYQDAI